MRGAPLAPLSWKPSSVGGECVVSVYVVSVCKVCGKCNVGLLIWSKPKPKIRLKIQLIPRDQLNLVCEGRGGLNVILIEVV